jgi:hypothetical protein
MRRIVLVVTLAIAGAWTSPGAPPPPPNPGQILQTIIWDFWHLFPPPPERSPYCPGSCSCHP